MVDRFWTSDVSGIDGRWQGQAGETKRECEGNPGSGGRSETTLVEEQKERAVKKNSATRGRIAGGCVAGVVAMTLVASVPAGAQVETDIASGDEICSVVSMDDTRLLATSAGVDRTKTVPVDLPAGVVSIPSARAWDAYEGRALTTPQTSERYEIEFIGVDGSIVGVSAPTVDVPDSVESAEWVGSLGTVTLSAPAVGVRAHHRNDLPADFSPDSVNAGDFTVCFTPEQETTVSIPFVPEPEIEPTTPDTAAAPTTDAPATTAVPTTAPTAVDPAGPVAQSSTTAAPTTAAPTTAAPAAAGQSLPVTGSETPWLIGAAGILIAAGAALTSITRRSGLSR